MKLDEAKLVTLEWNVTIGGEELHKLIILRRRVCFITECKAIERNWTCTEMRKNLLFNLLNLLLLFLLKNMKKTVNSYVYFVKRSIIIVSVIIIRQ